MGDRRNVLKSHRASLFNDDLSNEPSSGGSISLDSTFHKINELLENSDILSGFQFLQDYDFQNFQSKMLGYYIVQPSTL
jgi:hypothetical protein